MSGLLTLLVTSILAHPAIIAGALTTLVALGIRFALAHGVLSPERAKLILSFTEPGGGVLHEMASKDGKEDAWDMLDTLVQRANAELHAIGEKPLNKSEVALIEARLAPVTDAAVLDTLRGGG